MARGKTVYVRLILDGPPLVKQLRDEAAELLRVADRMERGHFDQPERKTT
jgi:hypothetical protein